VLSFKVSLPIAVQLLEVVLSRKAFVPTAQLDVPVVFNLKA